MTNMEETIKTGFIIGVIMITYVIVVIIFVLLFQLFWNFIVSTIFGLKKISFLHSITLMILLNIFFQSEIFSLKITTIILIFLLEITH